jgi:putative membrane protein
MVTNGNNRRRHHPHIQDDKNALIRTTLANQRTFLSYVRTALTFFVTGVGFLKFFETLITDIIGWVFIPIGVATFIVGVWRYNELRVRMKRLGG